MKEDFLKSATGIIPNTNESLNKTSTSDFFVVIRCGYEGIEKLVYASADGKDASLKVKNLRQDILNAREHRKKVLEEYGEGVDGNCNDIWDKDIWDKMYCDKKITEKEWNDSHTEPDSYCVQKWDGQQFSCTCKELDCEPENTWLM